MLAWDQAGIAPGDRVLVVGASGGVGSFAVSLAAERGAEVTALTREDAQADVLGWGAARAVRHEDAAQVLHPGAGFDAILDLGARVPLRVLREALAPGGTVLMVAAGEAPTLGPIPRMLAAAVLSRRRARIAVIMGRPDAGRLRRLVALAEEGRLTAHIGAVHAFDDLPLAIDAVSSGKARGKIIVEVADHA